MRSYVDSAGSDSTAAVVAFLATATTIYQYDLFWMRYFWSGGAALTSFKDIFLSLGSTALSITNVQSGPSGQLTNVSAVYLPAIMDRGDFEYDISLDAKTTEIRWYLDDSDVLPSYSPLDIKTAIHYGYLDGSYVWMHRAIFDNDPRLGGVLLGTTPMWRGIMRGGTLDQGVAKFTVSNFMEIFQDTQIPTQLIQPGARIPPFMPAGSPNITVLTGYNSATSTPLDLHFTGPALANGFLRDYYMSNTGAVVSGTTPVLFGNGLPQPWFFALRDNITSGGTLHVYPYEPIYPVNMIPSTAFAFGQFPVQAVAGFANGFPYVPAPEIGV